MAANAVYECHCSNNLSSKQFINYRQTLKISLSLVLNSSGFFFVHSNSRESFWYLTRCCLHLHGHKKIMRYHTLESADVRMLAMNRIPLAWCNVYGVIWWKKNTVIIAVNSTETQGSERATERAARAGKSDACTQVHFAIVNHQTLWIAKRKTCFSMRSRCFFSLSNLLSLSDTRP